MSYATIFIWWWHHQNVIVSIKLFDICRFYILSPVLIQNLSPPTLFSHCPALLARLHREVWSTPSSSLSSFLPWWMPMLPLQPHQRILEIYPRTLLRSMASCWPFWILRAVECIGAYKATGQKQSVSFYFSCLLLLLLFITQNALENNQPVWFWWSQ